MKRSAIGTVVDRTTRFTKLIHLPREKGHDTIPRTTLYKTELIRGPQRKQWKTVEDVELATLSWVHWFNTSRVHSYLNDLAPDELEAAHYAAQQTNQPMVGIQ